MVTTLLPPTGEPTTTLVVDLLTAADVPMSDLYGSVTVDKTELPANVADGVVCLLDCSGSIGSHGPAVSACIRKFIDRNPELTSCKHQLRTVLWATSAAVHTGFHDTHSNGGGTNPSEGVAALYKMRDGPANPVVILFTDGDIGRAEMQAVATLLTPNSIHTLVAFIMAEVPAQRVSVIMPFVAGSKRAVVYALPTRDLAKMSSGEINPAAIHRQNFESGASLVSAVDITLCARIPQGACVVGQEGDTLWYVNAIRLTESSMTPTQMVDRNLQIAVLDCLRSFQCRGDARSVQRLRAWFDRHTTRSDFRAALSTHMEPTRVATARATLHTMLGRVTRQLRENEGRRDAGLDECVRKASRDVARAEAETRGEIQEHLVRWVTLRQFVSLFNERLRTEDTVAVLQTGLQSMGIAADLASKFKRTTTVVDDADTTDVGAYTAECTICTETLPACLLISGVPGEQIDRKTLESHRFAGPQIFPWLREGVLPGLYCRACAGWLVANGRECPLTRRPVHAVCRLLCGIDGADKGDDRRGIVSVAQAESNRLAMRHELAAALVPIDSPVRPHVSRLGGLLLTAIADPTAVPHLSENPLRDAIEFLARNLATLSSDRPIEEMAEAVTGDFFGATVNCDANVLVVTAGLLLRGDYLPSPPDKDGAVRRLFRAAILRTVVLRARELWLLEQQHGTQSAASIAGADASVIRAANMYRNSYCNLRKLMRKGVCQYPHFHIKRLLQLVACPDVPHMGPIDGARELHYWRKLSIKAPFAFDDEERAMLGSLFPGAGFDSTAASAVASTTTVGMPLGVFRLDLMEELVQWDGELAAEALGRRAAGLMNGTYALEYARRNLGINSANELAVWAFEGAAEDVTMSALAIAEGTALSHVRGRPFEKLVLEMRDEEASGIAAEVIKAMGYAPASVDTNRLGEAWSHVAGMLAEHVVFAKGVIAGVVGSSIVPHAS